VIPVVVEALNVSYGAMKAVNDVSFSVGSGELVVLAGANGAGKTSTLEAIEGYRTASSGRIELMGLSPSEALAMGSAGVLLQDDGIYPAAKVEEVVRLFVGHHGQRGSSATELLDTVGLTHRATTQVRKLSGGEHRRLGLALALCGDPEVLLLDEPTAGVDAVGRERIANALTARRDRGVSILMTTHELALAESLADRVVVLNDGRVVADDTVRALTTSTAPQTRFVTDQPINMDAAAQLLGLEVTEVDDCRYLINEPRSTRLLSQLASWASTVGVELGDIDDGRNTLESALAGLISSDSSSPSRAERTQPRTRARTRRKK
jgi:ABC-2 type transport system ATP-binding protein